MELVRIVEGVELKLCREYTDLSGSRHRVIFDSVGPAGNRWRDIDGYLLTIDVAEMIGGLVFNPWSVAINVVDSWVIEIN